MAYKTRAERAIDEGDYTKLAQMIVADLMAALKQAESTDERLRLTAELSKWMPKAQAGSGRPAAEQAVPPHPAPERRAPRPASPIPIDWEE